jgi:hypothetical protein|tara:strand:+ start:276 stop:605 length:330 start_codon:yes stop_codon:yes gene_type:complete
MAPVGNRNYKRGREFEYKTRDHLLNKMGAIYVMRAAQSKGAADLIALFPRDEWGESKVFVVQCKRDGKLPRAERVKLCSIAKDTGTVPVHAYQGPRGTPVVIELLEETS